jgi:hypothetical protein
MEDLREHVLGHDGVKQPLDADGRLSADRV